MEDNKKVITSGNIPTQTYAYETNPSAEQSLKIKKAELKELRVKVEKDKRYRLAKNTERRVMRDDKIDRINLKLKSIKEKMVYYNRAGKVEKDGIDILETISNLIRNDVELIEDIKRSKPIVTDEMIEAESVDEDEVSPPGN